MLGSDVIRNRVRSAWDEVEEEMTFLETELNFCFMRRILGNQLNMDDKFDALAARVLPLSPRAQEGKIVPVQGSIKGENVLGASDDGLEGKASEDLGFEAVAEDKEKEDTTAPEPTTGVEITVETLRAQTEDNEEQVPRGPWGEPLA